MPAHILIAENDPDRLHVITIACQRAGYEVTGLIGVEKALDTAVSLQPDLIIAAPPVLGANSNEFVQQIRSNPRTKFIPVIQRTAFQYSAADLGRRSEEGVLDYTADADDVDSLLARVHTLLEFKSYLDTCEKAAFTDHLTGLANRRCFERQLEIEVTRTLRKTHSPFSLVLIDIDHFKKVNDIHGHQVGDEVIKRVAKNLQAIARGVDFTARIGGEEFGLILPETSLASAMEMAEGVRLAIKADELPIVGRVSVSIGVAEFSFDTQTARQLFRCADTALYEAKRKGRDLVEGFKISPNSSMVLTPGTQIGRYTIRAPVAPGGVGQVYVADDNLHHRQVALKLLPAEFQDDAIRHRFLEDARIVASLKHPNLITVFEVNSDIKGSFITVEYVEGQTLAELLNSRRMGIMEVINVAIQVASALSAAHNHGIIHRDIKPSNIMIGSDASVKVIDFGIARLDRKEPHVGTNRIGKTDETFFFGTPYYLSPEQATGANIDVRSDIWSLGVVMYEMLAGRHPFLDTTLDTVIAAIMTYNPFPIPHHPEGIPKSLERIVECSLQKQTALRYQTVTDVLLDLETLKREMEGVTETDERTAQTRSQDFEEMRLQLRDRFGEQAVEVFRQTIDSEAIAQKYIWSRYRLLINRKHASGLSTSEKEELESLTEALDKMDEPFYQRVIDTLQRLDKSRKN